MLDQEPLTLVHPAVQAAKAKWEAGQKYRHSVRHNLTFEDFFEYFKADCVRHTRVAELTGLSRERIRQIYNRYFREIFDNKSGRQRGKACTLENRLVKVNRTENELFETDTIIKTVVEKARAAGCEVRSIPYIKDDMLTGAIDVNALLVNGHRCAVHSLSYGFRRKGLKRVYTCIRMPFAELVATEAVILFTSVAEFDEHLFVMPSSTLREVVFGNDPTAMAKTIYLPTEKLPIYNNQRPRIDWWEYEEAWHLLPPKQDPPAP